MAFPCVWEGSDGPTHEKLQAVSRGLAGLDGKRAWAKWVLQSGGGAGCKQALKEALGWKDFEALEQELANAGVEAAPEMDQIDVNLGDMGVMYVFEDSAFWQCH